MSQTSADAVEPQRARFAPPRVYRLAVAAGGCGAVVLLLPWLHISRLDLWIVIVLVAALADSFLVIPLPQRRFVSLASTFVFVNFMVNGAAAAVVGQTASVLLSHGLSHGLRTPLGQASRLFVFFNIGQLALSALLAGAVVRLLTGQGLAVPAGDNAGALLLFSGVYLLANIALTTGAVWLSHGWQDVRTQLWPQTSLWTIISFAFTIPLALLSLALARSLTWVPAVLLVFLALSLVSWMIQLNVQLRAQNRELARANRELQGLNEVGKTLSSQVELPALGPTIYAQVSRVLRTDAFFFATVTPEAQSCNFQWVVVQGRGQPGDETEISGLVAHVAGTGRPVLASTPAAIHQLGVTAIFPGRFTPQALIAVPVLVGDRVVGVLSAQSASPEVYQERHLYLLETIASQAAIAFENARLVDRLRQALRDREDYLSIVSHELKNPITSIRVYAQLASRRANGPSDPRVGDALKRIDEQTNRLNRLVDDLLELSRIDNGRFTLEPAETDLRALLVDAIDAAQATFTGHCFHLEIPSGDLNAFVDAARIRQVLDNLLSNAAKYSHEGTNVTVTVDAERDSVRIAVTDEGVGISPEDRARIFERFYRVPQAPAGEAPGAGLGLNIVLEIVRAHDGSVDVTSAGSCGSTFSITLPRRRAEG